MSFNRSLIGCNKIRHSCLFWYSWKLRSTLMCSDWRIFNRMVSYLRTMIKTTTIQILATILVIVFYWICSYLSTSNKTYCKLWIYKTDYNKLYKIKHLFDIPEQSNKVKYNFYCFYQNLNNPVTQILPSMFIGNDL